jgi:hypothetical protein
VWHLTDFQGGKLTPDYNTDVMQERVHRYVDKARRLTEIKRSDHPVRDCTILFGGDLIEGLMNFPQQPYEVDATIFSQFATAGRLAAEIVRKALSIYEHVTVVGEWGNHGRIGSEARRDPARRQLRPHDLPPGADHPRARDRGRPPDVAGLPDRRPARRDRQLPRRPDPRRRVRPQRLRTG